MGSPKGRESYGDGVLIVVVGVTPYQGDGRADYRAKQDRKMSFPLQISTLVSVMLSLTVDKMENRRAKQ
jgi:hypothetical protein